MSTTTTTFPWSNTGEYKQEYKLAVNRGTFYLMLNTRFKFEFIVTQTHVLMSLENAVLMFYWMQWPFSRSSFSYGCVKENKLQLFTKKLSVCSLKTRDVLRDMFIRLGNLVNGHLILSWKQTFMLFVHNSLLYFSWTPSRCIQFI